MGAFPSGVLVDGKPVNVASLVCAPEAQSKPAPEGRAVNWLVQASKTCHCTSCTQKSTHPTDADPKTVAGHIHASDYLDMRIFDMGVDEEVERVEFVNNVWVRSIERIMLAQFPIMEHKNAFLIPARHTESKEIHLLRHQMLSPQWHADASAHKKECENEIKLHAILVRLAARYNSFAPIPAQASVARSWLYHLVQRKPHV